MLLHLVRDAATEGSAEAQRSPRTRRGSSAKLRRLPRAGIARNWVSLCSTSRYRELLGRSPVDRETELRILVEVARSSAETPGPPTYLGTGRYSSAERARLELERVFRKSWIMVARSERLAAPGAYLATDLAGIPLLVLRAREGGARAFWNACRHRGMALVPPGTGVADKLSCPFHGWTYALDGALRTVPSLEEFPALDLAAHALRALRCEEWGGFVWVNADERAPSLASWLGVMRPSFEGEGLESWVEVHRTSREVAADWKLGVETFLEGYHIATLHPRTASPISDPASTHVTVDGPHVRFVLMRRKPYRALRELAERGAATPEAVAAAVVGLMPHEGAAIAARGEWLLRYVSSITHFLFPHQFIVVSSASWVTIQFWPLAPGRCRFEFAVFCERRKTYLDDLLHAERIKFWTDIFDEDTSTLVARQRSYETGAISRVVLGGQERAIVSLHEHLDRALDGESTVAPASHPPR
jgi:phenylpropionate dioxygenase-like ring-hydroxylating dioxygenase large terminal subunit